MKQVRYALERVQIGVKAYYISRTKWTPDLAAATLFQSVQNAQTEITLLPDASPHLIKIRTVNLIPGKIIS